jgi:dihydrodipicolinate reductase
MPLSIAIIGAKGRMGQANLAAARAAGANVVAALDRD